MAYKDEEDVDEVAWGEKYDLFFLHRIWIGGRQ